MSVGYNANYLMMKVNNHLSKCVKYNSRQWSIPRKILVLCTWHSPNYLYRLRNLKYCTYISVAWTTMYLQL